MGIIQLAIAALPRVPKRDPTISRNPFVLFGELKRLDWLFFAAGYFAWTCDAIDFFGVSLSVTRLAAQYNVSTTDITTSITLTLLFRSAGAVIFGIISDRYGRKFPLVGNLFLVGILSLATAFCTTFQQFLAVRSLFGIGMGGIWGMSVACALENMPVGARGIASGFLQQGYSIGYLLAAVMNISLVRQYNDWRILFYFGAGMSFTAAAFRAVLPESEFFLAARAAEKAKGKDGSGQTASFFREAGKALKMHWKRFIYAVLLMAGMNFFSHGSQDLYPTIMQRTKGFSPYLSSLATIIGNLGAVTGGALAGHGSQIIGRRVAMILCCVWVLCFLPLWLLPLDFPSLAAGAFFLQAGVQGAWGVIPILLTEISPPAFRALFSGLSYQLGNMISSASAQIEAKAGETVRLPNGSPDYGLVSTILIGVVAAWIILLSLFGVEAHASRYDLAKAAFEEGAGEDANVADRHPHVAKSDAEKGEITEVYHESDSVDDNSINKNTVEQKEYAQASK